MRTVDVKGHVFGPPWRIAREHHRRSCDRLFPRRRETAGTVLGDARAETGSCHGSGETVFICRVKGEWVPLGTNLEFVQLHRLDIKKLGVDIILPEYIKKVLTTTALSEDGGDSTQAVHGLQVDLPPRMGIVSY